MANPNKARGTAWESAVRDYLQAQGIDAYRPAQAGAKDTGDLHGLAPFVGQAKDWKDTVGALRVGTDGAVQQAVNAGQPFGVNFVKRRRAGVDRGYAVTTVATFVRVLARLRNAESLLAVLAPDHYADHVGAHS